jgi:outer membrane protein TolC
MHPPKRHGGRLPGSVRLIAAVLLFTSATAPLAARAQQPSLPPPDSTGSGYIADFRTGPAPELQQPPSQLPPQSANPPAGSAISSQGAPGDKPLPINLASALQLAGAEPIDVRLAAARIRLAAAQLDYAKLLWLPTIYLGTDYFRHDGQIQDSSGTVSTNSHDSFMVGAGPSLVFAVTDAIFEPLAARQVVTARNAAAQTAQNDSLLAVADAYFTVQQSRGELAGADDVYRRSLDLVERARQLAPALIPDLEVIRTRTLARHSSQVSTRARERWQFASADLVRILRLDPTAVVEPMEPPHLQVTLVGLDQRLQELIGIGLTSRPELANQQALVRQTLERIRQEKVRPFLPGIYLRGSSTPVTGTLAGGFYGGGTNDNISNFGAKLDIDLQVLWELKELGFGNHALVRQREAENEAARLELFRAQDTVAAQVAQALAQARSAAARLTDAEAELKDAVETVDKNIQGLSQTRSVGNVLIPVIRPQEAVASLQVLAVAYTDYYGAVADYDRAQFRLYHALGRPAQSLLSNEVPGGASPNPGQAN